MPGSSPDTDPPLRDRPWHAPDIVSLREYVEQRLDAAERTVENARKALADQVQQRFSATQEAIAADGRTVENARKALADQVQQRFEATQQAIAKAEQSMDGRMVILGQSVDALRARVELFITRTEVSTLLEKFDARNAENIQRQFEEAERKAEMRAVSQQREFELFKDALNTRMGLVNLATDKASEAMNLRLEGMNEFRAALDKQTSSFITRSEFAAEQRTTAEDRERLATQFASTVSRVELRVLNDKIDGIQSSIDKAEGRRTAATAAVALASSLIISLITGLVFFVLKH